ncbi:hypothetical protein Tco_1536109 [Tanacetum coccineum]
MEDQPLPDDASPTTLSPGYIADSDPEDDPEEDLEEDPADYPADGGDDVDNESSNDDDDDYDIEEDTEEEEEEEHLAPADFSAVPTVDPVPSAEDTMSVRPQTLMSATAEALITEYASAPTPPSPPPSPLSSLSSPLPHVDRNNA